MVFSNFFQVLVRHLQQRAGVILDARSSEYVRPGLEKSNIGQRHHADRLVFLVENFDFLVSNLLQLAQRLRPCSSSSTAYDRVRSMFQIDPKGSTLRLLMDEGSVLLRLLPSWCCCCRMLQAAVRLLIRILEIANQVIYMRKEVLGGILRKVNCNMMEE